MNKSHLIAFAIALAAIWVANNVSFVGNLTAKK